MNKHYDDDNNCVLVTFPRAAHTPAEDHGHCYTCDACLDHAGIPFTALEAWLHGAGHPMVVCENCNNRVQRIADEIESVIDKVLPTLKRAAKAHSN